MGIYTEISENLQKGKATQFRTGEEQARIARAGGVASGKARRKKAAAKKAFSEALVALPKITPAAAENLIKMGLPEEDLENTDNQALIAYAMIQKAMQGSVAAASFLMEMTGEDAYTKIQKERLSVERKKLALEQKRLEMEEKKLFGGDDENIVDSDGFIDALNTAGAEVWADGCGDEPDDIDDEDDDGDGGSGESGEGNSGE